MKGQGGRRLTEEQRALAEEHLWLAESIARKMAWLAPKTVDGDVLAPAREGLFACAGRFDPARGVRFSTYAYRLVTFAILDAAERGTPGFTERHRESMTALDPGLEEVESEAGGAGVSRIDIAAAGLCIGAATMRAARHEEDSPAVVLVRDEMQQWPEKERTLALRRFADGAPWHEVAAELGISEATAKRWGAKLRARLTARLLKSGHAGGIGALAAN